VFALTTIFYFLTSSILGNQKKTKMMMGFSEFFFWLVRKKKKEKKKKKKGRDTKLQAAATADSLAMATRFPYHNSEESVSSLSVQALSLSLWKEHFVELGGIHKTPSNNRQKRRIQNSPFLVGWMDCCQLLLEFSKQLLQKMFCSLAEGKAVASVCSSLPC
jgi:hypothetical protein